MPPTLKDNLSFTLHETIRERTDLEHDWHSLYDQQVKNEHKTHASHSFLHYDFYMHWHDILFFQSGFQKKRPLFIRGKQGDKTILIAPFLFSKKKSVKQLEWAGIPLNQYGDILIVKDAGEHIIDQLFHFLKTELKIDLLYLRRVRETANLFDFLDQKAICLAKEQAPYIDLNQYENYDGYFKRFSQRGRKSRRRHRRKMSEKGALSFHLHEGGEAAQEAITKALKMKRDWLAHYNIISTGLDGNYLDGMFAGLAQSQNHKGGLLVSELKAGDQTIAIEIGFLNNGIYISHFGAYDQAYETHGPGALQMEDTIAALYEKQVKMIDLLSPGDKYKLQWTDQTMAVKDFALPLSLKGKMIAHLYLKTARPLMVKTAKNLPAPLKKLLFK